MDAATVRSKHKEFLFPCVANYYQEPVVITGGAGCCVRDADGRDYLDFFGGIRSEERRVGKECRL